MISMNTEYKIIETKEELDKELINFGTEKEIYIDVKTLKTSINRLDRGVEIIDYIIIYLEDDETPKFLRINSNLVCEIKDLLESRRFETFLGELDFKALLTYDIHLNVHKDYCSRKVEFTSEEVTEYSDKYRNLEKVPKELERISKMIYAKNKYSRFRHGSSVVEKAMISYFGLVLDKDKLENRSTEIILESYAIKKEAFDITGYSFNIQNSNAVIKAVKDSIDVDLESTAKPVLLREIRRNQGNKKIDILHKILNFKELMREKSCIDSTIDKMTDKYYFPPLFFTEVEKYIVKNNYIMPESNEQEIYEIDYESMSFRIFLYTCGVDYYKNEDFDFFEYIKENIAYDLIRYDNRVIRKVSKLCYLYYRYGFENTTVRYKYELIHHLNKYGIKTDAEVLLKRYKEFIEGLHVRKDIVLELESELNNSLRFIEEKDNLEVLSRMDKISKRATKGTAILLRNKIRHNNTGIRCICSHNDKLYYHVENKQFDYFKDSLEEIAYNLGGYKVPIKIKRMK